MPDLFTAKKKTLSPSKPVAPVASSQKKDTNTTPVGLFSAFMLNPEGITFNRQGESERVILFLRKHYSTNISWISIVLIFSLLPILFITILPAISHYLPPVSPSLFLMTVSIYYLFLFGYLFTNFITWFYNVGIITTEQAVDINFTSLTFKDVSSAHLSDVQDVEYTQNGFMRSFFNYGTVFVRTDSEHTNIEFTDIPKPAIVTETILNLTRGRKRDD